MTALECGVDTLLAAEPLGGLPALRTKSLALTDLFARLVAGRCEGHGLWRVSPEEPGQRGSQVCLSLRPGAGGAHDGADLEAQGYAIVQALIARGVIGDFRAGDAWQPPILRFGFTPLYTGFTEVWDAVEHLVQVLERGEWREARFQARAAVT
jgi:kynureninase